MDASIFLAVLGLQGGGIADQNQELVEARSKWKDELKNKEAFAFREADKFPIRRIAILGKINTSSWNDTVNDLDYLLDFVGRMTDYSEPDLVYLLKRLASLNYKSQPKSHRKTSVTNESWGRAACQKRRLQKLKGQKPYYKIYVALPVLMGAARQELRRLAEDPMASILEPSCKLEDRQEMNPCGQIYNEILAGTKGIRDVFNWVMQDKPITSRKLLIWDPGMFSTTNDELYHELYPPLSNAQEYKWIRLTERQIALFTLRQRRILQSTEIRLIDLGLAMFESDPHRECIATPPYSAPEAMLSLKSSSLVIYGAYKSFPEETTSLETSPI
ncbi:hypothetical protein FOXB_17815 [Fusarium oxysporum f. sp. conglutinans Fo5176]|uniref:Protein kinase domain-containing protein n=1 Tax=Fusarium oxysporum (strain Fo5176) TaxID=660025 RepID=F9GGN1_FUSOF|nr:hypothetical protein FOXB_17815 [Fusarium oxysporum f. sp. conglutinans Fo5176]